MTIGLNERRARKGMEEMVENATHRIISALKALKVCNFGNLFRNEYVRSTIFDEQFQKLSKENLKNFLKIFLIELNIPMI